MGKEQVEVNVCDKCGHKTLDEDELYKCIRCGKDTCKGVNCGYDVSVTVYHDIPNGIPFRWTQARYRICKSCIVGHGSIPEELTELLLPKENAKFYIKNIRDKWERRKIE